jgi:hypothetical protein
VLGRGWENAVVVYLTDDQLPFRIVWSLNIRTGMAAPILLLARRSAAVTTAGTATIAQVVLLGATFSVIGRLPRWDGGGRGLKPHHTRPH